MVRLRSGGGGHCSWELRAGGGSGGSGGSRPLCRLRVEALSLRLPCDRGALTVAGELLCGGHQDEFEAVILLEECGASDALAEATSDVDCGGLYPVSPGEAVGLLSPGYPARYPHNKQCLFALVPRSETHPPACFLDLDFADFNLAGSAAGGCASGDRLVVEGVPGAVFCDRRTGRARLALPPSKTGVPVNEGTPAVRLRFLSDGQGSGPGFRVLATLAPCEAAANDDGREEDILPVLAVDNDIVGNGSAGAASASLPFPQCCGRVHVGPSLFLTSPGFPVGLASSSECVFPVARLSPLTCRLRLVLHQFLLLGASLGACEKHFLQVDGRRLCGCRSRGQVVSYFRPGESVKLLRYYRHPLATGAFIAEVIQEDCASPVAGVPWARSVDDRDALWSNGWVSSGTPMMSRRRAELRMTPTQLGVAA
ncbi:hypothetical protein ONE63_004455 [Megalurothrips usitatus]|uniref:CUB domain-containing protein n=1 Tax=Megalurothrips usitatus TaxID=439358 RepID=A0AAV7X5Z7_9NEOP|nr:hypothetical protein ONE63_004455 [Megalurothrips usitatus]